MQEEKFSLSNLTPEQKKAFRFIGGMLGIYTFWYLIYTYWLSPHTSIDKYMNYSVAEGATYFLRLLGYDTIRNGHILFIDNIPMVSVGTPCNGFLLYVVHASFISAMAGLWKHKIPYIFGGIAVIFFVNIIRVGLLALNWKYSRETYDFNHYYVFQTIVYAIIFYMWVLWMNKFSERES